MSEYKGNLQLEIKNESGVEPLEGIQVEVSKTGEEGQVILQGTTNALGRLELENLEAPNPEYSYEPTDNQPYSEYTLRILQEGNTHYYVTGIRIFPETIAKVNISLPYRANIYNPIVVGGHTLWEEYPSKINEAEIKPVGETGEIVLNQVVVPELIVVHDGAPTDSTAKDYYVNYKDYIKNVAANEIYATWPRETIRANVLAIMSFTLNRVYTEWYRNKGYNFTITSSTAYDHKWIYGAATYTTIEEVVDELFTYYLARPNIKQPILTQYCDGKRVTCPKWMSQWGSKALGDEGYTAVEILKYYYGDTIYLEEAYAVAGIPMSWPGNYIDMGSSGEAVRVIQEELNAIGKHYPKIPAVAVDGIYGPKTEEAVKEFQQIFQLPVTGGVDYTTWYKLSEIYVAVTKIAENL